MDHAASLNGGRYAADMPHHTGVEPVAVVPLKALDRSKGRLAGHLDGSGRLALVRWMFTRVVVACRSASTVGAVLVVAGDAEAASLACELDVEVLVEPAPGLATAMAAADRATAGAAATLVVAADLPLTTAPDLDAVCRAGRRGPCVVVAPTHDGGTAALLRRPAGVVPTSYGPDSASAHLQAARAAGVRAVRVDIPALALDVDTAEDLRRMRLTHPTAGAAISGLSGR